MPAFMQENQSAAPPSQPPKRKKNLRLLAIIVAALVVIGGGAAAAYYGYVLPNKPENKLAQAFQNLAGQKHLTLSGTIDGKSTSGDKTTAVSIDYSFKSDSDKKVFGLAGSVGVNGATIPFDVRYVDQDLYAKVSGLNSLATLAGGTSSDAALYAQMFAGIDNQWYVLDHSYFEQLGGSSSCIGDISSSLSKEDTDKIGAAYKKYPLFTVKSSKADKVDGVAVTRYDLAPASDATAQKFAKELNSLSIIKKINECTGNTTTVEETIKDDATTDTKGSFVVYLTGDKQFKRLEVSDDEGKFKMTTNFKYSAISVEKPTDAKPIQDLLGGLLGGSTTSSSELETLFQ
jgi:hypothetical protein